MHVRTVYEVLQREGVKDGRLGFMRGGPPRAGGVKVAVAHETSSPDRTQGMLDDSIEYLHRHKLESLVSEALIRVVNSRHTHKDPRRRLWQLLRPENEQTDENERLQQEVSRLLGRVNELEASNAQLSAQLEESHRLAEQHKRELEARNVDELAAAGGQMAHPSACDGNAGSIAAVARAPSPAAPSVRAAAVVMNVAAHAGARSSAHASAPAAAPAAAPVAAPAAAPVAASRKRQESVRPQTAVKLDAMMGRLFETLDKTKVCMHRVHGPCALCTSVHPVHL